MENDTKNGRGFFSFLFPFIWLLDFLISVLFLGLSVSARFNVIGPDV